MGEDEIGKHVVDGAVKIHQSVGSGLLETVYEVVLAFELTYLRLADKRLGYLLNFGAAVMRDGIIRVANRLPQQSQQKNSDLSP